MEKNLQIEYVNIEDLKEYKDNPRLNDLAVEPVVKSIEAFGFNNPILIDKDNNIVAGHTRLEAAKRLLIKEVPVIKLDLTEAQFKAFNIADNKTAQFADWDNMKLLILLQQLEKEDKELVEATGFSEDELFELKSDKELRDAKEENFDEDSALEKARRNCKVKTGQVWQLGRHKLLCGDVANAEDVKLLMDNKTADLILTDPPYGVDYATKNDFLNKRDKGNRIQTPIIADDLIGENYYTFSRKWLETTPFSDYNSIYIFSAGKTFHHIIKAMKDLDIVYTANLVWIKNNHILGRADYLFKHENILYGWKKHHKWYGEYPSSIFDDDVETDKLTKKELVEIVSHIKTTVLRHNKPHKSELHPTMKPLSLLKELIQNSSKANDIVYDPFGGSGSTLIAAEQTLRSCYMIEIVPVYCQVIIDRWESYTGEQAKCLNHEE